MKVLKMMSSKYAVTCSLHFAQVEHGFAKKFEQGQTAE